MIFVFFRSYVQVDSDAVTWLSLCDFLGARSARLAGVHANLIALISPSSVISVSSFCISVAPSYILFFVQSF
jgi:hypothetical protein